MCYSDYVLEILQEIDYDVQEYKSIVDDNLIVLVYAASGSYCCMDHMIVDFDCVRFMFDDVGVNIEVFRENKKFQDFYVYDSEFVKLGFEKIKKEYQ